MKKKLLWIFCPLVFFVLIVLFLPLALSTNSGKDLFLKVANTSLPGTLSVEKLSLSWRGPQEIEGLKYKEKSLDFTCKALSSTAPLTAFISTPYSVGEAKLINPSLTIRPEALISLHEKRALQTASFFSSKFYEDYLRKNPINLFGKVTLEKGALTVLSPSLSADFEEISCFFQQEKNKVITLKVDAKTIAEEQIGEVRFESILKTHGEMNLSLKADLTHFPTYGADQILTLVDTKYKGLLREFTGPFLNMSSSANISKNLCEIGLTVNSDNLNATMQLGSKGGKASLTSPALVKVTLPPSFLTKITDLPLSHSLPLTLTVNTLSFPVENTLLLQDLSLVCHVTSDPYPFREGVTAKIQGDLSTENISKALFGKGEITLTSKEGSSQIVATGGIENPLSPSPTLEGALRIDRTPLHLFSYLIEEKELLDALGDWVEGDFSLKGKDGIYEGLCSCNTPFLSLENASIKLQESSFSLNKPTALIYQIEPEIANSFLPENIISLGSQSAITLNLETLSLSKKKGLFLDAKVKVDPLNFTKIYRLKEHTVAAATASLQVDTLNKISLSIHNPALSLSSEWGFKESVLQLKKPLSLQYLLKRSTLKSLEIENVLPAKDLLLDLTVSKAIIPFNHTPSSLEIDSSLKVESLTLVSEKKEKEAYLKNSELVAIFSGAKDSLFFSLRSFLISPSNAEGEISCKGTIKNLLQDKPLSILAEAKTKNFAIELVDEFYPMPSPLTHVLGNVLDASFHLTSTEEAKTVRIDAKTPLLSLKGGLALDDKQLALLSGSGPLLLNYDLTPEGYDSLFFLLSKKKAPFILTEGTKVKGSILELKIPLASSSFFDIDKTFLKASVENKKATFARKGSLKQVALNGTRLLLQKTSSEKELLCTLDTETDDLGSFHLEGTVAPHKCATLQATAVKMPSLALDVLIPMQEDFFKTLLGNTFDLRADLAVERATGPLSLHLSSPKASFNLNGDLRKGALHLKEKARLKLAVPPETSALFLKEEKSPILHAETLAPVTVDIDPNGFSFPISPFSLDAIQASHIRIDFGKVHCKSDKSLDLTFKIFRSKGSTKRELDLWFAPLDMQIRDGIIDVERTEVLVANKFDCALWGAIKLPKDKVKMTLGITASALRKALKLQGLPDDYVLKIPIRGTLDNITVDGDYASSKITALMIWKNKAVQKGLGPFGEILNQVIPPPGGDGDTPPPKHPFPWESN